MIARFVLALPILVASGAARTTSEILFNLGAKVAGSTINPKEIP